MAISSQHHSFDIRLAGLYGVEEAILIHHFQHWVRINYAAGRNIKDGRCWTYQSRREIQLHFPYWNVERIRYLCQRLVELGVLVTANYNKSAIDKTLWYAFVNEKAFGVDGESSNKFYERENPHSSGKIPVPCGKSPKPIPDTKSSDTKLQIKAKKERAEKSASPPPPSDCPYSGRFEERIQMTMQQYKRIAEKHGPEKIDEYAEKLYRWSHNNESAFKKKKRHDLVIEDWIEKDLREAALTKVHKEPWTEKNLNPAQIKNWRENQELIEDLKKELPFKCKGLEFYYKAHLLKDKSVDNFSVSGLISHKDFCRVLEKHLDVDILNVRFPNEQVPIEV